MIEAVSSDYLESVELSSESYSAIILTTGSSFWIGRPLLFAASWSLAVSESILEAIYQLSLRRRCSFLG